MDQYPKQDKNIVICTAEGSVMKGLVNIAGRSISSFMQSPEPDIIVYDVKMNVENTYDTLIVTKDQVTWAALEEGKTSEDEYGIWKKMAFKVLCGNRLTGEVDITGYDRISDYVQRYDKRFHEVYECKVDGEKEYGLIFVSRHQTVWKEPI